MIVDVPRFQYPGQPPTTGLMGTMSDVTLIWDGSSIFRYAFVLQVPKTGTLDGLEINISFVSSMNPMKISFQDVDTSTGFPDGTVDQYFVQSGLTTGWKSWTLTSDGTGSGTKRSVTKGAWVAVVFEFDSTQTGWCQYKAVGDADTNGTKVTQGLYTARRNATTWAKTDPQPYPSLVLRYTDSTYPRLLCWTVPFTAVTAQSFASNSTPDERALKFSPAVPMRVMGLWAYGTMGAVADLVLYDSSNAVLGTVSLDPDLRGATTAALVHGLLSTPVDLTAGATYRVAVRPTTTTAITLHHATVNAAALLEALPGGTGCILSTRTDAGAWTDSSTNLPYAGVLVDGLDAGGGGSTSRPVIAASLGYRGIGVS